MGKQYEMAFAIGAKVQGNFGSAFKNAASSVQILQSSIDSLNRRQSDISSYQKTEQALERTRSKLQLYQAQYANLKAAIEQNGQASAAEQNQLLAKAKAIDDLKSKEEQLAGKLQSTGNALQKEGVDLSNLGAASSSTANQIEALKKKQEDLATSADNAQSSSESLADSLGEIAAATGVVATMNAIKQAFVECAEAAISFEADMAAVKRTVGGDDEYIDNLGESFKTLSTQIPITASELASIASTAGQLGIAQDKVESFSVVMAKLATTTDLTADEAASMLAQFANITGLTDYERMGAVVARLGDSTATTASKVVQMSQGMAAAANIAGMSATDIMAISAAVGSLGIEAQAGSTSMSQLITTLYKATETGENLSDFASVAGMSAEQFKQAWADDAVSALNAFVTGLNDVERNGRSAIVILDELGINNVRQQKAILGLASAGNLLSSTISQANAAWEENTALEEKAGIMYETTQSKLTMLSNAFQNVQIAVGDAFTPAISAVADALNGVVEPISQWIEENPKLVQAIGTAMGIMGGMVAILGAYTVAAKIATAASAALTAAIPGAKALLAVSAVIALVAGAATLLSDSFKDSTQSLEDFDAEFDTLNTSITKDQQIYDLAQNYKKLANESERAVGVIKNQDFSDIDITLGATADPSVNAEDFMINGDLDVDISGIADESVLADDLLLDDNNTVEINGEAGASVDVKELITGTDAETGAGYVTINGEDGTPVDANDLITGVNEETGHGNAVIDGVPGKEVNTNELWSGDGTATITGVPSETKVDADSLVNNYGIKLHGTPDNNLILDANVLVNNETPVSIHAQWDNMEAMQADVEKLKADALQAKTDLKEAKTAMADLEERQGQLQTRLEHAETEDARTSLRGQLEEVNKAIEAQREEVEKCETAYQQTAGQYVVTESAAKTLQDRLTELKAIEDQLGISAGNEADAHSENAEAMMEEADAAAKEAANRIKANVSGGASSYVESVNRMAEAEASRTEAIAEAAKAQAEYDDYANSYAGRLRALYGEMKDFESAGDYDNAQKKLQQMNQILQEAPYEDFGHAWLNGIGAADAFIEKYADSYEDLAWDIDDANGQVTKYAENIQTLQEDQQNYIDNIANAIESGVLDEAEARTLLNDALIGQEDREATVNSIMERVKTTMEERAAATEEAADASGELAAADADVAYTAEDVATATQPIIDQMEALSEAYTTAYEAAYNSIDGQLKLFQNAPEAVETSVTDMVSAMDSQLEYIQNYRENLQLLEKAGLDKSILAELSDGTAESAGYIQALVDDMAKNGGDSIDEINNKFAEIEKAKGEFADTVAEMQTDFTEKMTALETQLNTTVENMNKSDEAASAGASTIQAFADAAAGKQSAVESAFAKVAAAAMKKLSLSLNFPGFAGGTENAPEGFAMVGENGPELVYLNGGEKIMDASETQRTMDKLTPNAEPVTALQSSGNGGNVYSIDFKPQFNLSGSSNTEELRAMLEEQTENMRGQLEEMLDEIENDRTRRKYA